MKTLLLNLLLLITACTTTFAAVTGEYLIQIELNTNTDYLNDLEKLKLPILLLQDDYLITAVNETKLNLIRSEGISFKKLSALIPGAQYYLITHTDKRINPPDIPYRVLFSDEVNLITAAENIDRDMLLRKGYSVTQPDGNNYFRNERTILRNDDQAADSIISMITSLINKDSVQYFIQKLQDFQTRYLFAGNRDSISQWIGNEFLRMGYTDVKLDSFQYQGTTQKNVVATMPGTTQPDKYVVTGGHHDSYSNQNPMVFAPGADDNASGTAAVLETARVLKAAGYQSELTIKFITFAAEELGLWGSKDYAQKALNTGMDIKLMINHDMISHTLYPANQSQVDLNYYTGSEAYRELAKQMASQYSILTPRNGSANSSGSDSHSFWTRGYKAIYFEETNFSPYYHSPQDIITNYNMEYCAEVVKSSCATLLTSIMMPDQVKNYELYDLGTGTTVLAEWSPNTEPDLAYYKIYIGTTSGSYTTFLITTDTSYTITGLTDGTPYFIAAAAVDLMGNESMLVERSVIPRSMPQPPEGFTALPGWHKIDLSWDKNTELDLLGYNVYRSTEQTGTYIKLNQSVLTDTTFTDNAAQNAVYYFYFVKAVDTDNNESNSSTIVKSRVVSLDQGILVVDETEDGDGTLLNPTDLEVDAFYQSILDGFRFQTYDINAVGLPQLADLGAFSTVIWSGDDGSNHTAALNARDVLKSYMEYGGNFFYSGYKPSRAFYGSAVYPLQLQPGSFLYDMLKIRDLKFTIFARFFGGDPLQTGYNYVNIDSAKTLPLYFYHLSNIESIGAATSGTNIYSYDTKYDTSTAQASMKGLPVGVEYLGTDYKSVTLTFPLYYMQQSQAKELINFILLNKFNEVTGVNDQTAALPEEYGLLQNYPNPFNPATVIGYQIPASGKVSLTIYDLLGRETAVLVDEFKAPGYYSTRFNAEGLASGIYFYKLQVQPVNGGELFIETRKMILLK